MMTPLLLLAMLGQMHPDHAAPATLPVAPAEAMPEAHAGHAAMPGHAADRLPLGVPVSRVASGTSWLPDGTPMPGWHARAGRWSLMVHGNVHAGYNVQAGPRGDDQWTTLSWFMLMGRRNLLGGSVEPRFMFSFDPLTLPADGYPLLLQTGESAGGRPLFDRQHPHELFMEIALVYRKRVADGLAWELYVAPVGEPALGPTAYPHRLSSLADPFAPLAHHWQDATHILFGVITSGFYNRWAKLEGSWFNGREPDEHRTNFDFRRPDSFSGRFQLAPSENWTLQGSYGFLESPEGLHPDRSLHRATASVSHTRSSAPDRYLASTLVWARNVPDGEPSSDAWRLESAWRMGRHEPFARVEWVEKEGHDLVLRPEDEERLYDVLALGLGYLHHLPGLGPVGWGIGARGTLHRLPERLADYYGSQYPVGGMVFVNLRPAAEP